MADKRKRLTKKMVLAAANAAGLIMTELNDILSADNKRLIATYYSSQQYLYIMNITQQKHIRDVAMFLYYLDPDCDEEEIQEEPCDYGIPEGPPWKIHVYLGI